MRMLADENFPGPALEALRKTGWDVLSIAEECPGVPDEEVAALCADQQRILMTFNKDFGDLVFRHGLAVRLFCSVSRRIPPKKLRPWHWHWLSLSRIFAGFSAWLRFKHPEL